MAAAETTRKRKEHNYSLDAKRICIAILDEYDISISELSRLPNCPSKQDISRWMKQRDYLLSEEAEAPTHTAHDFRSALTMTQLHILGGYILWLLQRHRLVDIAVVKDFVSSVFNHTISSWWVSHHMAALGFSSQRTQPLAVRYMKKNLDQQCMSFIHRFRRAVRDTNDGRKIVSVDQICFYKNCIVAKAYAPVGR
jgi:hypothetical protein